MTGAVLVTGGAGYIGSHVARQLNEAGRHVVRAGIGPTRMCRPAAPADGCPCRAQAEREAVRVCLGTTLVAVLAPVCSVSLLVSVSLGLPLTFVRHGPA